LLTEGEGFHRGRGEGLPDRLDHGVAVLQRCDPDEVRDGGVDAEDVGDPLEGEQFS
jgi:hypothetical protein